MDLLKLKINEDLLIRWLLYVYDLWLLSDCDNIFGYLVGLCLNFDVIWYYSFILEFLDIIVLCLV